MFESSKNIDYIGKRHVDLLFLLFIAVTHAVPGYGQTEEYDSRKVTITTPDSVIKLNVLTRKVSINPDHRLDYFWYFKDHIYTSQGDYTYYPLHGEYRVFNKSGNLATKGEFIKGLKSGVWKRWFVNGKLRSESHWMRGKQTGIHLSFDTTGQLMKHERYKNGQLHGRCIYYDETGHKVQWFRKGSPCEPFFLLDHYRLREKSSQDQEDENE